MDQRYGGDKGVRSVEGKQNGSEIRREQNWISDKAGNEDGPDIRREQNWISDKAGNEDGSEMRRGRKLDQR